jgi:anti-sigma28 factor (negative regulator of flagellin synthesis)
LRIPDLGSTGSVPEIRPAAKPDPPGQNESSQAVTADHSDVNPTTTAASQALAKQDDRVAELRQRYLSGSYQTDSAKIAAKIVDEHLA